MEGEPRKRSSTTWIIVVVVAVLALLLCACGISALLGANFFRDRGFTINRLGSFGRIESRIEQSEFFEATSGVEVEVDVPVGQVLVIGTDNDQVEIDAEIFGYAGTEQEARRIAEEIEVRMEQESDGSVQVEAIFPRGTYLGQSPNVHLTIRVPRECELDVAVDVGEITIEDVEAAVQARSDVGEVTVRDLRLTGDSEISSGVGDVEVELTSDSSFELDASTGVGEIRSNLDLEREDDSVVGDSLRGPVGDNPQATLRLRADTGSIRVDRD